MPDFSTYLAQFEQASTLPARQQAAQALAQVSPEQAWPVLRDAFLAGHLQDTIPGLIALQKPQCIRLFQRSLLEQGGNPEDILAILRALGQLGAVSELAQLVEDPFTPPIMKMEVLQLLTQFSTPDTHRLFLQELNASSRKRQILAILTLGQWRVAEAVMPLTRMLRRQTIASMRRSLCWALGAIATPQALRTLQGFLISADTPTQMELCEVLSQIPHPQLAEVMEALLPFLDPQHTIQLTALLEQHHQRVLQERATQLKPWQDQWEEALFEEEF